MLALAAASLVISLAGGNSEALVAAQAPAKPAARTTFDFQRQVRPLFEKYCVDCHSGTDPEAGLDVKQMLDGGVPKHRKVWEKALALVKLDNMPPADSEQPTNTER